MSRADHERPKDASVARHLLMEICAGLDLAQPLERVRFHEVGDLASAFPVSDFAAAAIGAAGLAASQLIHALFGGSPAVSVDRRLASAWFGLSIHPIGWSAPPPWDPIAGNYEARDGWIRLHTNAPHHREAALRVLGCASEKAAVIAAVRQWSANDLESAIVTRGGCAATMRSLVEWSTHPQGAAVAREPIARVERSGPSSSARWDARRDRPLHGLRVLDCTRVLAGPVATRFLAGLGAEVLRIDPPDWDEPAIAPEVTLGKRCARVDIKTREGRKRFAALLGDADLFIHGLRPDALDALDLGADARERIRPGLIDVALDAYGWTGPWAGRRGFDSLVQMSAGIAEAGMRHFGVERPKPLPVQAIDHATGYVLATAAIKGLLLRLRDGGGFRAQTSLARMAGLLASQPAESAAAIGFTPLSDEDWVDTIEETGWGPGRRLKPPLAIEGAPMRWRLPASRLGSAEPEWAERQASFW
jgi:hypothetical protein